MRSGIKTYDPRCKVKIQTCNGETIEDLTPSIATIRVQKSVYSPVGTWSISMLPHRDKKGISWYHRVEPMDYIDIRFARFAENMQDGKFSPIMRGFLDTVGNSVTVDESGAPQRGYSFTGRDYGKLLQITMIYYNILEPFRAILKEVGLLTNYQIGVLSDTPAKIIGEIFDKVLQPQFDIIKGMYKDAAPFGKMLSESILGKAIVLAVQSFDGDVHSLLQHFDNSPWNELYIDEQDEGPFLVFRKTPWKDEDRNLVQGEDEIYPKTGFVQLPYLITPSDVISFDINRSDHEVRNYLYTYPVSYLLDDNDFKAMAVTRGNWAGEKGKSDWVGNPYFFAKNDLAVGMDRYGYRPFVNRTEYVDSILGQAGANKEKSTQDAVALCQTLTEYMAKAFRHNSLYESGVIQLKGNENIKPGMYVQFGEGELAPEFYVVSVMHDLCFQISSEYYRTTLQVVRGDGYIKAKKKLQGAEIESMRRISGRY